MYQLKNTRLTLQGSVLPCLGKTCLEFLRAASQQGCSEKQQFSKIHAEIDLNSPIRSALQSDYIGRRNIKRSKS